MSRKTPAQERYISALRRGKSKEEAEWTRDNPPGMCRQHPDRAAWSPQKRDCEECRKAKRNAAQAKERAKLVTSKCQKCGKDFQSKKYAYRVNCPDCHAGKGASKKPKDPKPVKKPVQKPLIVAPSSRPGPKTRIEPLPSQILDTPAERAKVAELMAKARIEREKNTAAQSRWDRASIWS